MTPERLNELQALCDAASPAPWGTVENSVPSPAILLQFEWNEADQEWDRNVGKINGVPDAAFIAAARTALPELIARVRELEASFGIRWAADMRAIKAWQAAHPGNEMTWPDHADLCVWLLEQLEAKR